MKFVIKTLQQLLMKKKTYRELKKSIRMIKSETSDTKKNNLIEEGKRKGIDEVIRQNA